MTRTEHLLMILVEECAEVAQRVSKALHFGLTEIQPGQPLTNAERVVTELDDLLATFHLLRKDDLLPGTDPDRQVGKQKKIEQFLTYSAACGTLDGKDDSPRSPRTVEKAIKECDKWRLTDEEVASLLK